MNTATFFLELRERANYAALDKMMKRKGGEKPKLEDQTSERLPAQALVTKYR